MLKKQEKSVLVFLFTFLFFVFCQSQIFGQGVKRVVVIKADGVPMSVINKYVAEKDPSTGKSKLPWIEEVFFKNGSRLENFYVRGISLSAPSWSLLDTGQHLQIKGNVEFNRYTSNDYYYLNFVPFQIDFGLKNRIDMPGVEMLDRIKIPLLADAFPYKKRILSYQLFQRDNRWETFAKAFAEMFKTSPMDLIDEYTIGFSFGKAPFDQVERDIVNFASSKPEIDYFDYYTGDYDHIAHHVNDEFSKYQSLKHLDLAVGRIWLAIQNSSRGKETAVFFITDHGVNSVENVFSQGFNFIKLLGGKDGGGHHIVTKRRPLTNYAVKPEFPFWSFTIESKDSLYLKNEKDYPTVLLDLDGNERASIHFRDSDLNLIHILLKELKHGKLKPEVKKAAISTLFETINKRREEWQFKLLGLQEELNAYQRLLNSQEKIIENFPKKYTPEEITEGIDKENIRLTRQHKIGQNETNTHREYVRVLNNLISLKEENFNPKNLKIEDIIPKEAMGERNSVYKLQNYIVNLSPNGLIADKNGSIDINRSFKKINYYELIYNQKVRNNVQKEVSGSPIDFIATEIPLRSISSSLSEDLMPNVNPIWIYEGDEKQALILSRKDKEGKLQLRYLPIAFLKQLPNGEVEFQTKEWSEGFPLKIFEDKDFAIVEGDRKNWLSKWHSETDWFNAVHKTLYSNGIIGLTEQVNERPIPYFEDNKKATPDEKLIQRLQTRQRDLSRADILVLANDHWNFDVVGFNPGGNHGSFFRISTHSAFMMAGGEETKIPKGLQITTPYDSLSFVPTILALMGKIDKNGNPDKELYEKGFRRFPGQIVEEVFETK